MLFTVLRPKFYPGELVPEAFDFHQSKIEAALLTIFSAWCA